MNNTIDWLILDWGTTNFRAFAMSKNGNLIDRVEHKLGLLQVKEGRFADELYTVLQDWLGTFEHLPIFMAGMVGSAQGWVNVPYVTTPVKLENLAKSTYQFTLPWGAEATIIPGVSHRDESGNYDVMRGEEVQLLGLLELTGRSTVESVFPGTHCKHVELKENTLISFKTFMTGELFSALSDHTILGRGLPEQHSSNLAFERGVLESETGRLTNQLFKVRTHRLFGIVDDSEIFDYLSGLLIGNEVRELNMQHIYIIGSQSLCERYSRVCQLLDKTSEHISGDDSFLAGMLKIKEVMSYEYA
jgi:2-dehydro-3-deoxygalactonokinase